MAFVIVRERFETRDVELFIFENEERKSHIYHFQDGEWIATPSDYFEQIAPSLIIPRVIARSVVSAISEFSIENGMRPERHEKLEGVLEATQAHLSDMRSIVRDKLQVKL